MSRIVAGVLVTGVLLTAGCASQRRDEEVPISAMRLVTDEFAYRHSDDPRAVRSPDWIVTSGSLFGHGEYLWSGVPDDERPGPQSPSATGSAVLRAVTARADYRDVAVGFELLVKQLTETARTAVRDHDGVHVMLRYRSDEAAYFLSVSRRDGIVTIKRKTPGGVSNGGTYTTLAEAASPVPPDQRTGWRQVAVSIRGTTTVAITLDIDGAPVLRAVDETPGAAASSAGGRVGLRGDNCEFVVRKLQLSDAV